jgi:hypothetical protein
VIKEGKLECTFKGELKRGRGFGITDDVDKSEKTLDFTNLPLGREPDLNSSFFCCFAASTSSLVEE